MLKILFNNIRRILRFIFEGPNYTNTGFTHGSVKPTSNPPEGWDNDYDGFEDGDDSDPQKESM